jgi:hypothetical protein
VTLSTLRDELGLDLVAAYVALDQAKAARRMKDSLVNRQAERDCYDVIDALLDTINESEARR